MRALLFGQVPVKRYIFASVVTLIGAISLMATAFAAGDQYQGKVTLSEVATAPPLDVSDSAWKNASKVSINYDVRVHDTEQQAATAFVLADGKYLYVAFIVPQREPITAQQHQNDAGLGNDDTVSAYFYPSGPNGFRYVFAANPHGVHVASSSENTVFAPSWESVGKIGATSYTVYMKIPLDSMKGGGDGVWRANFRRYVSHSLDDYLWSYNANCSVGYDPPAVAAGTITGLRKAPTVIRPKPRFGVYGLAEVASNAAGGSTSRVGIDASIPMSATSAFVSAIHPDYSNVEIDQQTIAPTAFPRYLTDVRPFFAQLQNYYNTFPCYACVGITPLYTPSIPSPRYANAVEGQHGPLSFAAFDSVGVDRRDDSQALVFQSKDERINVGVQNVVANVAGTPEISDRVLSQNVAYDSQKGLALALNHGQETGTLVSQNADGAWYQGGVSIYDKTQLFRLGWENVGSQFNPLDGYVPNPGLRGYSTSYSKTWYRDAQSAFPRVIFYAGTDFYHRPDGTTGQSDAQLGIGADFQHVPYLKKLFHVRGIVGSSYVQLGDGNIVPVTQDGVELTYAYRTATPIGVNYYTGRFGPGVLDYWTRQAAVQIFSSLTLSGELDSSDQRLDIGERNMQWLERFSTTWQPSKNASLSFGVRRIIGYYPVFQAQQPRLFENAWNLTAGYYIRLPHDEVYVVYGNPSQLYTVPTIVFKLIHYVGAEKGV